MQETVSRTAVILCCFSFVVFGHAILISFCESSYFELIPSNGHCMAKLSQTLTRYVYLNFMENSCCVSVNDNTGLTVLSVGDDKQ